MWESQITTAQLLHNRVTVLFVHMSVTLKSSSKSDEKSSHFPLCTKRFSPRLHYGYKYVALKGSASNKVLDWLLNKESLRKKGMQKEF